VLIVVLFVVLGTGVVRVAKKRVEDTLVEQVLHREQVVVKAGAEEISGFLKLIGKSLAFLAEDVDHILAGGEETQAILDSFIAKWKDTPLVEVAVIDEKGIVQLVANKQKTGMKKGISTVDRDYFIAAKEVEPGKVFVGRPILPRLGAYEGQYIISLTTPIYDKGKFKGVLGSAILLSELVKSYIDPLRISGDTRAYLLNSDGLFLHMPFPDLVGVNLFDHLDTNRFLGSEWLVAKIKEKMSRIKEEGEGTLVYMEPGFDDKKIRTTMLLAYFLVDVGDRDWILAVGTPKEDALVFMVPFHENLVMILGLMSLVILGSVALMLLIWRLVQREAYEDGFKAGKRYWKRKVK